MIWEPFVLALVLGLLVSAGLYFAYLWPDVEPSPPSPSPTASATPADPAPGDEPVTATKPTAEPLAEPTAEPAGETTEPPEVSPLP